MSPWTLFEWERRRFDAGEGMPAAVAERIARTGNAAAARLPGKPRAFELGRDALGARGVVGVVEAGGATCEILPKVDRDAAPETAAPVRERLVRMLGVAYDLPVADGSAAAMGVQEETLLELLIGLFARALADAVRHGMPRRYLAQEDDLPSLRGRLDVGRQFTALAASPQRLACRYDALSPDIALNRIMKAAVARLSRSARSAENARRLRELDHLYADIPAVLARRLDWAVTIDRTNARWRRLLALARLLLGDRHQTTSAGADDGFALLFDMAALWERYVQRLLGPVAAAHGLTLTAQGGARPCLQPDGEGGPLFHTFPDLQLRRGAEVVVILDAKWKRLGSLTSEDRTRGVAQGDVYQMMAYARVYACPRLVLLYPHHPGLGATPVLARHAMLPGGGERLTVASLDLSSEAAVRAGLEAILAGEEARTAGA